MLTSESRLSFLKSSSFSKCSLWFGITRGILLVDGHLRFVQRRRLEALSLTRTGTTVWWLYIHCAWRGAGGRSGQADRKGRAGGRAGGRKGWGWGWRPGGRARGRIAYYTIITKTSKHARRAAQSRAPSLLALLRPPSVHVRWLAGGVHSAKHAVYGKRRLDAASAIGRPARMRAVIHSRRSSGRLQIWTAAGEWRTGWMVRLSPTMAIMIVFIICVRSGAAARSDNTVASPGRTTAN